MQHGRESGTHAGQQFQTKTGKRFFYEVVGAVFRPSRTKYNISKADFAKALALVPMDGPGEISSLVRGSAYIWAVLHDRRIRKQNGDNNRSLNVMWCVQV